MKRFYAAATGAGVGFAMIGVAVPLQLALRGASPALIGTVLSAGTGAIAVGAACAGTVASRLGGGPRALAASLLTCACGMVMLVATSSAPGAAAASVLVGLGIGLFWVASHLVLGSASGSAGSEARFLLHYASYTLGAVAGSASTGLVVAASTHVGLSAGTGIRVAAATGVAAAAAALVIWLPRAQRVAASAPRAVAPAAHLAVQAPDFFLVSALALLLPLAPVVLADGYGYGPFAIGVVMSGTSAAKIGGALTARAFARGGRSRRTTLALLAGASALSLALCIAAAAPLFVTVLIATTLAATGAWPLVVDAAQARVPPEGRHDLSVVWNVREYLVVAAATFAAGRLFAAFGSPLPLYALAGLLIAAATVAAAAATRRPVWRPLAEEALT